jgi:hypothetical protein
MTRAAARTSVVVRDNLAPRWWTRPVLSAAVLLAAYAGLVALCDPRGTLGTDTGGKLATLREMDAGDTWQPDVGYWAGAFDPDALAHPLYYTVRFDDGYVNITTLPMLLAAKPLYAVGGLRLALALPMLGALAAAAAARALAARLGAAAPWRAFWLVGLASPATIYALDLWEHSLGLALMAWGVVALVDLAEAGTGRGAVAGALAGLAFGSAATLRTEALVYGAVFTAIALARAPARRRLTGGAAALGAVAAALALNEVLERAMLGAPLRSARAAGSATSAGAQLATRLGEALRTTIGLNYAQLAIDALVGGLLAGALAGGVALAAGSRGGRARRYAYELFGAAALLYAVRFQAGLGFVSGLLPAAPVTVAGMVVARRSAHRWLAWSALACLPLVWMLQFVGGAGPQWGGRYLLLSGWALAIVGIVEMERMPALARRAFVALAIAVTAYGSAYVVDRTHDGASTFAQVAARDEDLIIARFAHVFREAGAFYTRDRRWLTAPDATSLAAARSVVDATDPATIALITYPDDPTIAFEGYEVARSEPLRFFSESLEIRRYEARP